MTEVIVVRTVHNSQDTLRFFLCWLVQFASHPTERMIFRDDDFVAFYPRIHDGQHFTDQRDGIFPCKYPGICRRLSSAPVDRDRYGGACFARKMCRTDLSTACFLIPEPNLAPG